MANETNALHAWECRLPVGCAAGRGSVIDGVRLHQPHLHPVSRFSDTQGVVLQFVKSRLQAVSAVLIPSTTMGMETRQVYSGNSTTLGAGYQAPENGLVQPPIISMKACPVLPSWAAAVNRLFSDVYKSSYAVNV